MERVISPEERMKRAEEIYYRRRAQGVRVSTTSVNLGSTNKVSLGKKMIVQIIVCVLIYSSFWAMKNYKNIFSDSIINHTKAILNYDINFQNLYNQCTEYFGKHFNNIIKINNNESNDGGNNKSNTESDNESNDNSENTDNSSGELSTKSNSEEEQSLENNQNESNTEENSVNISDGNTEGNNAVSSAENTIENDGTIKAKLDNQNMTQMEQDAEFIKQNYSLIKPVEGKITSGFGEREETEIISAFHQGVDIGASSGTAICAAMEGTVVAASYAGDYGNHIKIQNGEVLNVYAHCSEINVRVGDYVAQGQEIGKVGATGKVTGPHLHFEFRRDGRYVNPEMIMSF